MSTGTGGYLWACLGGEELWSACLTSQLQANGHGVQGISCQDCAPCCGDLDKALGYAGSRGIGQAPWYEPSEPNSVHFAGLLVTNIEGLGPGEFSRTVTEAVKVGAIMGQPRQSAPLITVTGILMGDCCGADYGLSWLRSALRGNCRSNNCQGDDFTFLACDPEFPDEDCPENEGQDYEALLRPYLRTMKNVALVSGPTVTNKIPRACPTCDECPLIEVQFVLAAGNPCVYREPELLVEQGIFEHVPDDECVQWISKDANVGCEDCPDLSDCATDPDCQDAQPPTMPGLSNSCVTDCMGDEISRFCFTVPEGSFPKQGEGTLIMEIFAGKSPLRNVRVQVWNNPMGFPVDQLLDCDACSELNISYIGPDSTLTIDGTNRTAEISCPGGRTVRANSFIGSGTKSPAFSYPEFEGCGGPYTVCVTAKEPVSGAAFVRVHSVGKEC